MSINISISLTRCFCIILVILLIFLFIYRQPFVVFIDRKLKTANTIDDLYGSDAIILPNAKAQQVKCDENNPYKRGLEKEHFNEFFYNRGGISPEIFNIILPDFSKARKMEVEYSLVENSAVNEIENSKKWFDDRNSQNFFFNEHKLLNELENDDLFDSTIEFSTGIDCYKPDPVGEDDTNQLAEICSTENDLLVNDNINQTQTVEPLVLSIGQVVITVMKNNGNFTEHSYSNVSMNKSKEEIDDYEEENTESENNECETEKIATFPCFTETTSCRSTFKKRKIHLKESKKSIAMKKKHSHVDQIVETEELTTSSNLVSLSTGMVKKQKKSVKREKNHKKRIDLRKAVDSPPQE